MHHVITLFAALFLTTSALAQSWRQQFKEAYDLKSRNYHIVTDLPREQAQELGRHMDAVYDEYQRLLSSFAVRNAQPVKLYIWKDHLTYMGVLAAHGISGVGSAGMFFSDGNEAALTTWVNGQRYSDMISTLQHEGFHQFAHLRIGPELPVWANEGLAEYFGEALLVRGKLRTGVASALRIERVRAAVNDNEAYTFDALFKMDDNTWITNVQRGSPNAPVMYDQSWSIVHFLIHGSNGKYAKALENYLRAFTQGKSNDQALIQAFGSADMSPFESAWRKDLSKLEPDPLSTAVERLNFIASGLGMLYAEGVQINDFPSLKQQLQERNFTLTMTTHGLKRVLKSDNNELFELPKPGNPRQKPPQFVVSAPAATGQPPQLTIENMAFKISVRWEQDDEDGWIPEVEIR